MIKILREGNKRQVECEECGALLSYQQEDIKKEEYSLSQTASYYEKYIVCPQCKNKIILEATR